MQAEYIARNRRETGPGWHTRGESASGDAFCSISAVRIAIVTDFYYPSLGGITEHVDGQARELVNRGHEVTVITGHLLRTPPVSDDALEVPEPNFEIVRMGVSIPLFVPYWGNNAQTLHTYGPRLGQQLRALFRERGFDVVHVHAPYNPPFPAWAIDQCPDETICVATFHSVFPQTTGMDILAEWTRPWIERLDGRICVSEACIGSLAPYYPYAYDVIPNGIDADHFSPEAEPVAELLGDHQNIVFCGRFDPRNGLDTMIEAFRLLHRERGDQVRLVVIGDGPLRKLYHRQVGEELAPFVHFAGRLNRSRPNYLTSGSVFCTPCNRASFGMVLLEAMSCGRPVVASRISGFQLLMEDGRQGFLVHPGDSAELHAAALRKLLDDPDLRARMGDEGRRTALENYAWPRVAAKLEAYYADLLAGEQPVWASAKSSLAS
jgi:phosphatidyl-myo-inositol alpha-mannosyltransferase